MVPRTNNGASHVIPLLRSDRRARQTTRGSGSPIDNARKQEREDLRILEPGTDVDAPVMEPPTDSGQWTPSRWSSHSEATDNYPTFSISC